MKPLSIASALMIACLHALPAHAQTATVVGKVLDATSSLPVAGALVVLEPIDAVLIIESSQVVSNRTVVTGESGAYRFSDLVPGRYQLRIERLGYRAAAVDVDLLRPVAANISVGLEMAPISLEPLQVQERAAALFLRGAHGTSDLDEARVASEQLRQAMFLATDARMLTYADVTDGVTLGEGDVFRALQRFPGVGTRDDYTAELWTRGAAWTQTRVAFDGVPLFNPVHAVGILSAITPEILGSVFFHPGVRPASIPDGAAGVVDMRSRPGGGQGQLRAIGDASLATAKLVLDQHIEGRGSWLIAARRSHLELLTNSLVDSLDLPYVFHDVGGRADLRLSARAKLEVSGLWEEDRIEGDVEGILGRNDARWGNTAGRATLRTAIGARELNHTVGASRYLARTDARLIRTRQPETDWSEPASSNTIEYRGVSSELVSGSWSLGYDLSRYQLDYDGPVPRYFAVKPDTIGRMIYRRDLQVLGLWGDARVRMGPRIIVNPAVRIEKQGVAPRITVRWTASPALSLSVSAGRSWQHLQAIALAGPSVHPAFHASHFWIAPDARTPPIRADIISAGGERWLGDGWLASANLYVRHAVDIAVPDPTPGKLGRRPLYVLGNNRAHGVELGMRRIGAQWSASFGYTLGESELQVGSARFPSPADRRHTADAMVGTRISSAFRVAAAFTAMSGAPFTRAYAVTRADCTDFGFGCDSPDGSYLQEPNAERTPMYQSIDASLQWSHSLGRLEALAYVQLRNLLNRDNASTYSGSRAISRLAFEDRFEQGLPRLPMLGVRVMF